MTALAKLKTGGPHEPAICRERELAIEPYSIAEERCASGKQARKMHNRQRVGATRRAPKPGHDDQG
jgi:hypothetical protein